MNRLLLPRNRRLIQLLLLVILHTGCKKQLSPFEESSTPRNVFEVFWQVMDKKYSHFGEKNVNWDSVYNTVSPQISENTKPEELFSLISKCLDLLQDGHLGLESSFRQYNYDNFYTLYPKNFNLGNVQKTYLRNNYTEIGPFLFKIVDSIGYIYNGDFRKQIQNTDLEILLDSLGKTKAAIIDVRNNTGGLLSNAEALASRFFPEKTLVKFEKFKTGTGHDDFSEDKPFYISPAARKYEKPVAVLTNRSCYSACNDFVLYMSRNTKSTQIGDQTGGGGAIPFNFILPNGWKLQYSATRTLDYAKKSVEKGLLPLINVTITPIQETQGVDPIIEKAYQILR